MEVKRLKISKIETVDCDGYVYDIHMNNTPHTFFANDILVHNTDSCFFNLKSNGGCRGVTKDFNNDWIEYFNKRLKEDFVPTYNNGDPGEYSMMDIEWEKSFDRIYFGAKMLGNKKDGKKLVGTKKRYYGIEPDGKKYIKGLNIIRKDTPPFLKKRLNDIIELAVTEQLTIQHILDLRKDVEDQPYESIGVTKSYGMPFNKFKNKANHVEGAKFANEILGTKITHKDKPFLFFIESRCEDNLMKKDQHNSICLLPEDLHFIDERTDLFGIDYTTYFNKQVITQLKEFVYIECVSEVLKQYKEILKGA